MGYRDYSTAKGLIVDHTGHGDFTTIGAALAVAVSGQNIFIRSGTYTENISLVAGVNLTAFSGSGSTSNVTILGTVTASYSGSATISNVTLQTNANYFLVVSGASATVLTLNSCLLLCSNHTGISATNSNGSSALYIEYCNGNISTTGIAYFASALATVWITYSYLTNTGSSTTASTVTAGFLVITYCSCYFSVTSSGTAQFNFNYSFMLGSLILGGSSNHGISYSSFISGASASITINNTTEVIFSDVNSSAAHAITGSGTMLYAFLTFSGTTTTTNVSTQTNIAHI